MADGIYLVMGSRDTTDLESSAEEYPVCYYLAEEDAMRHADLATQHAARIETTSSRRGVGDAYLEKLARLRRENELDPLWSWGNDRPTTYRSVRVPRGRLA